MPPEVVDRGLFDLLRPGRVCRVVRVDLLGPNESLGLGLVGEVQAVPVDHRASTQHDADPFEVGEGEIREAAKLGHRHGYGDRSSRIVPTKIPTLTNSTSALSVSPPSQPPIADSKAHTPPHLALRPTISGAALIPADRPRRQ